MAGRRNNQPYDMTATALCVSIFFAGCAAKKPAVDDQLYHSRFYTFANEQFTPDSPHDPKAATPGDSALVTGEGKIVSLNEPLGSAVVQTKHGARNVWWRTDFQFAQAQDGKGIWVQDASLPNTEYREYHRPFPAKEGDMITFRGFESYGEILITQLAVKPATAAKGN